jgi:hypothetical protein
MTGKRNRYAPSAGTTYHGKTTGSTVTMRFGNPATRLPMHTVVLDGRPVADCGQTEQPRNSLTRRARLLRATGTVTVINAVIPRSGGSSKAGLARLGRLNVKP